MWWSSIICHIFNYLQYFQLFAIFSIICHIWHIFRKMQVTENLFLLAHIQTSNFIKCLCNASLTFLIALKDFDRDKIQTSWWIKRKIFCYKHFGGFGSLENSKIVYHTHSHSQPPPIFKILWKLWLQGLVKTIWFFLSSYAEVGWYQNVHSLKLIDGSNALSISLISPLAFINFHVFSLSDQNPIQFIFYLVSINSLLLSDPHHHQKLPVEKIILFQLPWSTSKLNDWKIHPCMFTTKNPHVEFLLWTNLWILQIDINSSFSGLCWLCLVLMEDLH